MKANREKKNGKEKKNRINTDVMPSFFFLFTLYLHVIYFRLTGNQYIIRFTNTTTDWIKIFFYFLYNFVLKRFLFKFCETLAHEAKCEKNSVIDTVFIQKSSAERHLFNQCIQFIDQNNTRSHHCYLQRWCSVQGKIARKFKQHNIIWFYNIISRRLKIQFPE